MKALIAFGTKYGSTARIAETIGEELEAKGYDVDIVDLGNGRCRSVDEYDLVVLGSSIFIGKWTKEAREFIEASSPQLAEKRVAMFVSCSDVLFPEKIETARKNYLDDIAAGVPSLGPMPLGLFGGVIDFDRYSTMTRFLLTGVGTKKALRGRGIDPSKPYDFRDWGEVRAWARSL